MSTTYVKREYGYGPASMKPDKREGREYIATDTLKHTLDANDKVIELNPPGDWDETNPEHPSYISGKPDIDEVLTDLENIRKVHRDVKLYGVLWDKTSSHMRRIFDSAKITTDTTNFVYSGSVNQNYDNPFDRIYPWSECKQCNVDLDLYRAQSAGDDIRDCIVSWYGDYDFALDGSNGFVGRYTPEFWYFGYEDANENKIIVIADGYVEGFLHHKPSIRSHGFAVDDGDGGVTSHDGQPMSNVACSTIHSRANSSGFTLMDIFEYDVEVALYMVEFADTDAQAKLGNGCSACSNSLNFTVLEAATGATTVLLPIANKAYYIPGATIDFSTTKDGVVLANRRIIVSSIDYSTQYCQVTLDSPIDLTTDLYPSIHGKNNADSIGNKSGYVGVNGKNNAWYRGAIMYGNRYQYTLGAYRQTGTGHLWLATPETADDYDAINTSDHYDTGIEIYTPESNSWQQVGDYGVPNVLAAFGPITKAATLVGDQQYCALKSTGNAVAFLGGYSGLVANCGVLCANWAITAGNSTWYHSVVALLKSK